MESKPSPDGLSTKKTLRQPELWTIGELVDSLSANPKGKRAVSVPRFQRALRWNTNKQSNLIDSIRHGYPIGALLLYFRGYVGNRETFLLVDGLQRSTTLSEYERGRFAYFNVTDVSSTFITELRKRFITLEQDLHYVITLLSFYERARRSNKIKVGPVSSYISI